MIDQIKFQECLKNHGIEFITGVPDTLLNEFCLSVSTNWPQDRHVISANEGNAVALAAGYHLANGTLPLVYMQNSGIGNSINPLISLTNKEVYSIPMILLIGWRGNPSVKDHPQHKKQGELTTGLLESLDIPYIVLNNDESHPFDSVKWASEQATINNRPVALIAQSGIFEKGEKEDLSKAESIYTLSRERVIELIIDHLPDDTLYVATTGRATRELYHLRRKRNESHQHDFLNIGAMGHTSSIAAGIAISQKKRLVVCLDGDSSAIMHLGALTTNGQQLLPNFLHVILNNGAHESVGGQPSVGYNINFTEIAKNSGYATIDRFADNEEHIIKGIEQLIKIEKPGFIDIHIKKGMRGDLPPLNIEPEDLKIKFMQAIKNRINE